MTHPATATSLQPTLSPPRPSHGFLAFLGLLILVLIAYWPVLRRAGYIWDDPQHLTKCAAVQDPAGLPRIWLWPATISRGDVPPTQQYYPMVFSSFWLECRFWSVDHPLGFHLTNLLLHAATAALIYLILHRLKIPGALLAAALFAVHPVQVESVAWISERKNVLAAFFFMLTILAYLRFARLDEVGSASRRSVQGGETQTYRWPLLGPILLLFAAALLSKSIACALPPTVLLITWYQRGRLTRSDLAAAIPLFLLGLAAAALTIWVEHRFIIGGSAVHNDLFSRLIAWFHTAPATPVATDAVAPTLDTDWDLSLTQRLLIAGRAFWFYPRTLLWPANLTFIYPRWDPATLGGIDWLAPAAMLFLPLLLLALHKKIGRGPFAAIAFYALNIFPALGFFNIYPMRFSFVADHFQYIACLGPILLLTVPAGRLLNVFDASDRWMGRLTAAPLLGILIFLSYRQGPIYQDQIALWQDTIARNPACWMARENLADIYHQLAQFETDPVRHDALLASATDQFTQAQKLRPTSFRPLLGLGQILLEQRKFDDAESMLGQAHYNADPPDINVLNSFALAYIQLGRHDRTLDYLENGIVDSEIISRNGTSQDLLATAHAGLAATHAAHHEYDDAAKEFAQAEQCHLRAITLEPANPNFRNDYATTLIIQNKLKDAIDQLRITIKTRPDFAPAYLNLGEAERLRGQFDLAVRAFREAIRLNPMLDTAHANLALTFSNLNRRIEALAEYRAALTLYPNSMEYLCNVAELISSDDPELRSVHDLAEATLLAKKACDLTNNRNGRALFLLAQIYAAQNMYAAAHQYAQAALTRALQTKQEDLANAVMKTIVFYRNEELIRHEEPLPPLIPP